MVKSKGNTIAVNIDTKVWNYVHDYSNLRDLNEYLTEILGAKFREYRKRWKSASSLKTEFDFPLFLVFETIFKCNLRCVMCIHSSKAKQKYEYDNKMPFAMFKKIMEESSRHYCPSLTFGGTSEPFLDDNIIDMISLAKNKGFIDIMLNTNATLLNDKISRQLIESGLTRLRIGFDGLTAATYEKIRVGANFEKVKNNILNFMRIRKEMKAKLPIVRLSCVRLSENEREIKKYIEFWKPIVDYVSIQTYRPHEFTKKRLQMGIGKKTKIKKIACSQPFERLYIRGNGDVHACCNVAFGPKVGNVLDDKLYNIWNSDKMCALRNAFRYNTWNKISSCRKCLGSVFNV